MWFFFGPEGSRSGELGVVRFGVIEEAFDTVKRCDGLAQGQARARKKYTGGDRLPHQIRSSKRFWMVLLGLFLSTSTLACGEFGQGVIRILIPPKPISTLVVDPDDARLLENGSSVAVNANQGRLLYSRRLADQKSGSLPLSDVWVTLTFDENEATVSRRRRTCQVVYKSRDKRVPASVYEPIVFHGHSNFDLSQTGFYHLYAMPTGTHNIAYI